MRGGTRSFRSLTTLLVMTTAGFLHAQNSDHSPFELSETRSTNRLTPVVKAVHATLPSVVSLSTERVLSFSRSPWGDDNPFSTISPQAERSVSLGSGFFIDETGLILTNAHVIHNARRIEVTTHTGRTFEARRIAEDPSADIALLRIVTPVTDSTLFPPIKFGRVSDMLLGETVISMGNPYGLGGSVATGVISGIGRKAVYNNRVIFDDIIQLNVAVNPGNSGSPLVNLDAETIGMAMSNFKAAEGIAFGVPLTHIRDALARWLVPENAGEAWLGLSLSTDPFDANMLRVQAVAPGSPAENAGFTKDDKIVAIDDQPLAGTIEAGRYLFKIQPQRTMKFQLLDGRILRVTIEALPLADGRSLAQMRLGIGLHNITPAIAKSLRYPLSDCVVVTQPITGSNDVKRGDILLRLNHIPIASLRDVARALRSVPVGTEVQAEVCTVTFNDKGDPQLNRRTVPLKIGK